MLPDHRLLRLHKGKAGGGAPVVSQLRACTGFGRPVWELPRAREPAHGVLPGSLRQAGGRDRSHGG